jgi:hypothetical protein
MAEPPGSASTCATFDRRSQGFSLARVVQTRAGMRRVLVLAICLSACGGRTIADEQSGPEPSDASTGGGSAVDASSVAFPVGTFTHCAEGSYTKDGAFLNVVGFEDGAELVLSESGPSVHAKYVDQNGLTSSFDFTVTTNTSAALASPGQTVDGFTGLCVHGVGFSNEEPVPAAMSVTAGSLTYQAGTVFLSVSGPVEGGTSDCPPLSTPGAFWLVCDGGPAPDVDEGAPAALSPLAAGSYDCTTELATYYESGGINQYVTSGGYGGTLSVTSTSSQVTAVFGGDKFIQGTLHFGATTAETANGALAQSLTTACEVPIGIGLPPPPETPETLPVKAASLMLGDSTLVVSYAGSMDASSPCPGAQKAGSFVCTKK